MSHKYRNAWAKLKKAIPTNREEEALFDLMMEEERRERLENAIATLAELKPKGQVGAPRKTGGDVDLVERLIAKRSGDTRLARQDFIKEVTKQDGCGKKRATARFKAGLDIIRKKA